MPYDREPTQSRVKQSNHELATTDCYKAVKKLLPARFSAAPEMFGVALYTNHEVIIFTLHRFNYSVWGQSGYP